MTSMQLVATTALHESPTPAVNGEMVGRLDAPGRPTIYRDAQAARDAMAARAGRSVLSAELVARIVEARRAGYGWSEMARALDAEGIPTARGGLHWYPSTVQAVYVAAMRDIDESPFCGACGGAGDRLRRLGGVGAPLCYTCYQRAKRAAHAADEDLRAAGRKATISDLYSHLVGKGLARRTLATYQNTIWGADAWFDAQGWSLARATPTQVAAYAATKPMSFATQSLLRIALGYYWELTQHPSPPVRAIRCPPKPEMVCKALGDDDARILAKVARERRDHKGLAVVLGLYQAMRRAEIASARWDAIDGDWLTVVGKGAKTRVIPLHTMTVEALSFVDRRSEWIFPGRNGSAAGHVSPMSIWNWIRAVADEAGIDGVRPHWLRHTCLAKQNDVTKDLRTVQHFAGHARSATTEGYTRATRTRLLEAVAAVDY